MIAICAVFTLAAIFVPMGVLLRMAALVLFGGGGAMMPAVGLNRKVALRVDESGITLGGIPLRYEATIAHVPWRDIEAVMLWRQATAPSQTYVGILRPDNSPPLPGVPTGPAGQVLTSAAEAMAGAPDTRLVAASRAINGWRLDTEQLTAAMRRFAPSAPLIDRR